MSPVVTSSLDTTFLSPALSHHPAVLEEAGWELWELLGQWLGQKAQREGGWQGSCTKKRRRLPWAVPTCPAALQCPRLPWAGDELLWASKGVPSPSWDETGSQDAQHGTPEQWDGLVLVPRAGGTALGAIPPCLPTESGGASSARSPCWHKDWGAAGSQEHWALQPGKPHRDTTAQPGQGQEKGLVRWERSWR